jgi:copper chaperone CopZ
VKPTQNARAVWFLMNFQHENLADKYAEDKNVIKLFCDGITCSSCENVIRNSLRDVPNILGIEIDIEQKMVYVTGTPLLGRIIEEIETFGFSITIISKGSNLRSPQDINISDKIVSLDLDDNNNNYESNSTNNNNSGNTSILTPESPVPNIENVKADFLIEGMTCASCVNLIETMARDINGILSISVNLLGSRGAIVFDPSIITAEKICEEITDIGFKTTEILGLKPGTFPNFLLIFFFLFSYLLIFFFLIIFLSSFSYFLIPIILSSYYLIIFFSYFNQ